MATRPDENPSNMPLPPLPEAEEFTLPEGIGPEEPDDGPLSFGPPARGRGIQASMVEASEGRVAREFAEKDARVLHEFVAKLKGGRAGGGYLEVSRVGPPNLPRVELGILGKLKVESLKGKDVVEEVQKNYGGGAYQIQVRTGDHGNVPGGFFELEIVGNIVPQTREGAAWLRNMGPDPEEGTTRLMRELLDRQAPPSSGAGNDSLVALLMQQQQQMMQTMREDNDKRRREEDQRRQDEREERRRKEELEREERIAREKREAEERARQQAEFEAERRERMLRLEAQLKEDAAERAARHQQQLEELKADREERLKRFEMQNAGALGMTGLKRIMGQVEELFVDKIRETASPASASDAPDSWGDVGRQFVLNHGGDLLGRVLDIVSTKGGTQPAGAGAAAAPGRRLPPPVAQLTHAADPEAEDAEPSGAAPAAAAAPVSSPESEPQTAQQSFAVMAQAGAAKAAHRLVVFVRLMGSELLAQGDAQSAWTVPQDENEPPTTLADVYLVLPGAVKAAWRRGWHDFTAMADRYAHADLEAIAQMLQRPDTAQWLRTFMESGPYDEEEASESAPEQEPEEEEEVGDADDGDATDESST